MCVRVCFPPFIWILKKPFNSGVIKKFPPFLIKIRDNKNKNSP